MPQYCYPPQPERFAFEWRRPRLTVYRAGEPKRFAARLNRYPGVVIGAAVQVAGRVISLTWGAPGRVKP
ncbi:MAG TPA: hypothetical protein VIQ30_08905 [Pseudonocardia sp.]